MRSLPVEVLLHILLLRLRQLTMPTHRKQLRDLRAVNRQWRQLVEDDGRQCPSTWFAFHLSSPWGHWGTPNSDVKPDAEQCATDHLKGLLKHYSNISTKLRRLGISVSGAGGQTTLRRLLSHILPTSSSWEEADIAILPDYPEMWPVVRDSLRLAPRLGRLTLSSVPVQEATLLAAAPPVQERVTLHTVREIRYVYGVSGAVLTPNAELFGLRRVTIGSGSEDCLRSLCGSMPQLRTIELRSVSVHLDWETHLQSWLSTVYAGRLADSGENGEPTRTPLCKHPIRVVFSARERGDVRVEGQSEDETLSLKYLLAATNVVDLTVRFCTRDPTFGSLFAVDQRWFHHLRARELCKLQLTPTMPYDTHLSMPGDCDDWVHLLLGGVISARPGRKLDVVLHDMYISTDVLSTSIELIHRDAARPQASLTLLNCVLRHADGHAFCALQTCIFHASAFADAITAPTTTLELGASRRRTIAEAAGLEVITSTLDDREAHAFLSI